MAMALAMIWGTLRKSNVSDPKPGIRNRPSQNPIRIDFFVGQTNRYVRRTHLRKKKAQQVICGTI